MPTRHFAGLILIALLTACGTSAPTHYYLLDGALGPTADSASGEHRIGIGPVQLPKYLDRPEIVTRAGSGRLDVDEFNLWAEPLGSALPRLIALGLHKHAPQLAPIIAPWPHPLQPHYRFRINIHRFDAEPGRAVLTADWSLQRTSDGAIVTSGTFDQSEPAGASTISDRVNAESRLLDGFAAKLATVAAQHLGTNTPAS